MLAGHHGLLKMASCNPKNIISSQIVKVAKKQMENSSNERERSASAFSQSPSNWNSYSPFTSPVNAQDSDHKRSINTSAQSHSCHHRDRPYLYRNRRCHWYGGNFSSSFDNRKTFAAHYSSSFSNASSSGSNYLKQSRDGNASENQKQDTRRRGPWIPFVTRDRKQLRNHHTSAGSDESVGQNKSSSTANWSSVSLNDSVSEHSSNKTEKAALLSEADQCDKTRCVHSDVLVRKWKNCVVDPSVNENSQSIGICSVMSYNILSQSLLNLNKGLYKQCDPNVLPWTYRWNNIQKELAFHKPDIMCLQEVEEDHFHQDIQPWFAANGYTMTYKRRTGNQASKPDGVLTAWLSTEFEVVYTKPVEYFRERASLTAWHNVGLINVIKLKPSADNHPSLICVANTHLVYNPKRGDVKLTQLATFFAEIKEIIDQFTKTTSSRPPLLLCGDFNSTPSSPLYDFVTTGTLNYYGMSERSVSGQHSRPGGATIPPDVLPSCLNIDENCSFVDGNIVCEPKNLHTLRHDLGRLASTSEHRQFEATTMQDHGITVDYIFYSCDQPPSSKESPPKLPSSSDGTLASPKHHKTKRSKDKKNDSTKLSTEKKPKLLELVQKSRYSSCTGRDIYQVHGLPNEVHPSDHLPVLAEFYVNIK